jgi:elongation factor P--(R)-beta-lysine ligase
MLSKQDIVRRKRMWDDVEKRIHAFFSSRDFEHFRTPLIVNSPGMEPNLDPFEIDGGRGLITSPEYSMKKLLGAGFEKIYTITSTFRNNEPKNLHNIPEFVMLEWYSPGSYEDLMSQTQELLKFVLEDSASWPRFKYQEANMDEHGDPHVERDRFFVTHYPTEQAALANISSDGGFAERFEAFADGFELCNGFSELIDSTEQRKRFEKEQEDRRGLGKTVFPIDEELLNALDGVRSPVYGNALGVDRLVMLKYGVKDINDTQLFPYAKSK